MVQCLDTKQTIISLSESQTNFLIYILIKFVVKGVDRLLSRPMPTIRCEPSIGETEAVARELFTQFTREQFTSEGITSPEIDEQLQEFHWFVFYWI